MAPSVIYNNVVQGEAFLPGQIFIFGGFALRANSLGHLEQTDSYAPGHQVRFGSLNYTADIRRLHLRRIRTHDSRTLQPR